MLSKVTRLENLGGFRLRVRFNDGSEGVHDFTAMVNEPGPMLAPLRDPGYFARVFLEFGAPIWPNGFDIAPEWLRREMAAAGEFSRVAADVVRRRPLHKTEFPMVDVLRLRPLEGNRLWLRLTDGSEGVSDLSAFIAQGGPMVEPLQERDYFERVFVEMGAPTWPNGLDLDPINLYMELRDAGALIRTSAE